MNRPTPFELAFGRLAEDRFPGLRDELDRAGTDPRDRDRFLMAGEAVQLVRDLRPDAGLGDAIDQLVALVHHAFLFWRSGRRVIEFDPDAAATLTRASAATPPGDPDPGAWYARMPERLIWASVVETLPAEPLDGCFVHQRPEGGIRVLGVFGVRPDRDGFSLVEASGTPEAPTARPDGSAPFASLLAGGQRAALYSIADEAELLALGWRSGLMTRGARVA